MTKKNKILVFLSYSNKDKKIAADIKQGLERFGLSVFMAHDDIDWSEDWRDTVYKNLQECHVFIALLTENFRQSVMANQEAGFAIAEDKIMASLIADDAIDIRDFGFLEEKQAKRFSAEKANEIYIAILDKINKDDELRDTMQKSLVVVYRKETSPEGVGFIYDLLKKYKVKIDYPLTNGEIIKGTKSKAIYRIEDEKKRTFPDLPTFNALTSGGGFRIIPDEILNKIPYGEPFDSVLSSPLIHNKNEGKVYVVLNNRKHWVNSAPLLREWGRLGQQEEASQDELDKYDDGETFS